MCEVVGAGDRKPVVADVERTGQAVVEHVPGLQGREDGGGCGERGRDQDDTRRGQQAPGAGGVEPDQVDSAGLAEFGPEQSGDEDPEITKKTSTPTNPPVTAPVWKATTAMTATARRPLDIGPELGFAVAPKHGLIAVAAGAVTCLPRPGSRGGCQVLFEQFTFRPPRRPGWWR